MSDALLPAEATLPLKDGLVLGPNAGRVQKNLTG
jgi:hypothetical protein